MRNISIMAAWLFVLLSDMSAGAQEFKKTILTGGPTGTYIQIGKDLAAIASRCSFTLDVVESAGSLENLVAVKKSSNTQFGIVQSDVLEYVRTYSANDPELQRSLYGVRIMFPLYNEEIHLLAKRSINSLADLNGKKVAIGTQKSGTFLTATIILDIMKIRNAERLPVGSGDALPMLLNGEIDALFYVAGAPAKLFSDPAIDGSNFHLVNLTDAPLKAVYTDTVIPDGTYPFQPEPISTVAVKAVLMSYDYTPQKNAYHRESCKAVSDLSNIMLTNLEELRQKGHPKWKNVDLTELPPGWQVGQCVKTGMTKSYKVDCKPPSNDAQILGSAQKVTGTDEEYLKLLKEQLQN